MWFLYQGEYNGIEQVAAACAAAVAATVAVVVRRQERTAIRGHDDRAGGHRGRWSEEPAGGGRAVRDRTGAARDALDGPRRRPEGAGMERRERSKAAAAVARAQNFLPRRDDDPASVGHRVARVDGEIEQDHFKLDGVSQHSFADKRKVGLDEN